MSKKSNLPADTFAECLPADTRQILVVGPIRQVNRLWFNDGAVFINFPRSHTIGRIIAHGKRVADDLVGSWQSARYNS